MGHEYVGIVEEVGSAVTTIKPGQFVVGSFFASDNTCEICQSGYQPSCPRSEAAAPDGAQAERMRVPLADGTLVATPDVPSDELIPSLLAASDVLGTGWFAAVAAEAGPGKTVAVVGDGAVGLLGILAAQQLGAERIIAISRHQPRQKLALEFGATDIVEERDDDGVARIKDLTDGLGAHSVIEAVGTQESMMQAIRSTRPGGHVGYVGVNHGVTLPGEELFFSHVHLHGGPAPVRRFLPQLIDLIWTRRIDPGKVFDLELPLEQAAEGYQAMDPVEQSRSCSGPNPGTPRKSWTRKQEPRMTAECDGSFGGKVAFVTGAGSGIGRATALAFAREGASVDVADISDQGNQETARMVEELGGRALAVQCDVTRSEDVKAALGQAASGASTLPSTMPAPSRSPTRRPRSPRRNGTGSSPSTCAACSCA